MYKYLLCFFLAAVNIHAQGKDCLPSWNEGEAKKAIIEFVEKVAKEGSDEFIPEEKRVAVFDQDGTLWVEQPIYTQLAFGIDQIRSFVEKHPELKNQEPFRSVLAKDLSQLRQLSAQEVERILAIAFAGMTVKEFHKNVSDWLKTAIHPRFKKPFTDLVYQPMLEVIQLLRSHQFKLYIVSGGGQEFIRPYAQEIYGIPIENIIGSAGKVKYEYRDGQPDLLKLPEVLFINDKEGKPEGINLFIGQRPIAAFGNSTGDQQMLEWTQAGNGKHLELLVHHDDPEREYAYDKDSKIGSFPDSLMKEAKKRQWIVVSMKNDWKVVFPWQLRQKL